MSDITESIDEFKTLVKKVIPTLFYLANTKKSLRVLINVTLPLASRGFVFKGIGKGSKIAKNHPKT